MTKTLGRIQGFLKLEASAGILLMLAALLALIANNSLFAPYYGGLLTTPMTVAIGALEISKPLVLWINDGLMAIFFFLVGLEIKREVVRGELSTFDKAALPIFAAIGGMAIPALFYAGINWGSPETLRGWAIPAATDIAFALGILALLGSRAPVSLKIMLLAIAIIDDLGAIIIIALFYTADLSVTALALAAVGTVGLFILNRMGVKNITPYVLIGIFMWVCVLKSGVHATLAGVITALFIPLDGKTQESSSPLVTAEHKLHPWVAFMIVPVFAFANAGISFASLSVEDLLSPVPLGIAAGLFLGKPIGVLVFSFVATKLKVAKLPSDVNWMQMAGVACLTGVGFTMSLFIGGLAFDQASQMNDVRLGVLMGSFLSAMAGYSLLRFSAQSATSDKKDKTTSADIRSKDPLPAT